MTAQNDGATAERRYALYFTPPADHPLTRAAAKWLGRDAFGGLETAPADPLTAEPRRYGFHATLKAPFRLHEGRGRQDLVESLAAFAGSRSPCPLGPLKLARLGRFFALVPHGETGALNAFAAEVVMAFDSFRAPMTESELQRRLASPLGEVERDYLAQWGHPYVLDRFRFHMTLTGPVAAERQAEVEARLESLFGALAGEDFRIDALTLFEQENPTSDFLVTARFPLTG